jgi:hypothetical protein
MKDNKMSLIDFEKSVRNNTVSCYNLDTGDLNPTEGYFLPECASVSSSSNIKSGIRAAIYYFTAWKYYYPEYYILARKTIDPEIEYYLGSVVTDLEHALYKGILNEDVELVYTFKKKKFIELPACQKTGTPHQQETHARLLAQELIKTL